MSYLGDNCFNLTYEDEILLICARTQIDNKNRIKLVNLLDNDLNWDYLIEIATEQKIKPLIYWNLKSLDDELVPKSIMNKLKSNFHQNLQKNLIYLGHLLNILKLFDAKNIESIPYKGPVLAINSYGNLGLREFVDLDIFINKKDLNLVRDVLISNGYATNVQMDGFARKIYLKLHRDMLFYDRNHEVNIEIQWNFIGQSFTYGSNIFINPENTHYSKINNKEVLSLSSEDMLLVLCIHASGHLWQQISWISDIAEFINANNINWHILVEKSKLLGFNRILKLNILLALELLDLKISKEDLELISFDEYSKTLTLYIIESIFSKEDSNKGTLNLCKIRYKIRENRADGIRDFFKVLISKMI